MRLPPLNSLRAFHAVARHRSIRAAGAELRVSPQAVGQQLRQLEDALGVVLVEREGRGIRLTEKGMILADHVTAGFEELEAGVRRITTREERQQVNLNVSPYFSTNYLMPRLKDLQEAVPEAEIGLTGMVELAQSGQAGIDIAIQWGYPGQVGRNARLLLADPKIICCTPTIARRITQPADLGAERLLRLTRAPSLWPDILGFLGVDAPRSDDSGFRCDDATSMRHATRQGLGVGLLSRLDAERDIAEGLLVAPLGIAALDGLPPSVVPGFYLIAPAARLRAPRVMAIHRWLLDQEWND